MAGTASTLAAERTAPGPILAALDDGVGHERAPKS